jgi:hypothetical protein
VADRIVFLADGRIVRDEEHLDIAEILDIVKVLQ